MPTGTFLTLVFRLAAGFLAVQDDGAPVSADQAFSWATAVAFHAEKNQLDPFELVGVARNESDFTMDMVSRDGKDCGIAQTRTTYSKYRCRQLRNDAWIAFSEAARELSENQERCLRYSKGDLTRCRLNSYNSGVRYARSGWNGDYWLRVSCFAEHARRGVKPVGDCRRVQSRGEIRALISKSERAQAAPLASAGAGLQPRAR